MATAVPQPTAAATMNGLRRPGNAYLTQVLGHPAQA
jgi:hypothetical protein